MGLSHVLEHGFILGVAGAKHYQAEIFFEQLRPDLSDQVKAFLRSKARHNAGYRPVRVVRQAKFGQQSLLALAFSGKIVYRKFAGDVGVVLGAPLFVIHPVHDAMDRRVIAKKSIQPEAVLRRLNLSRVPFADRADGVAEANAAFEKVELAEKLELARVKEPGVQADFRECSWIEDALIA